MIISSFERGGTSPKSSATRFCQAVSSSAMASQRVHTSRTEANDTVGRKAKTQPNSSVGSSCILLARLLFSEKFACFTDWPAALPLWFCGCVHEESWHVKRGGRSLFFNKGMVGETHPPTYSRKEAVVPTSASSND